MGVGGSERRLAAVLAADMVGFSRLMEVDETGTLARLKTHRIELIDRGYERIDERLGALGARVTRIDEAAKESVKVPAGVG